MVLSITGLGMVSSVGLDVVQSCAALRAGITRPRQLVYFSVIDEEHQELVPLTGHPIHGFTDGFAPVGRWIRLARGCVDDLLLLGQVPGRAAPEFWQRTGLIWVGPVLDGARFMEARKLGVEGLKSAFLSQLKKMLELPFAGECHAINQGHAGMAAALQYAQQRLPRSAVDRFLIVATDSYLDQLSLEWLQAHRRLKSPDIPVGLMPGEAAACILVEDSAAARRRNVAPQAFVSAVSVGQVHDQSVTRRPRVGQALANVIEDALAKLLGPGKAFRGDIVCDLNGEVWRASEWGNTRVRLGARLDEPVRLVIPGVSLGDTGAASGAVALCMVVRSFRRKYASSSRSLVVSSSEHGAIGAFVLGAEA
jgi:3-oxoacyl-[acyl-carrier-protein] synthase-1